MFGRIKEAIQDRRIILEAQIEYYEEATKAAIDEYTTLTRIAGEKGWKL